MDINGDGPEQLPAPLDITRRTSAMAKVSSGMSFISTVKAERAGNRGRISARLLHIIWRTVILRNTDEMINREE